MNGKHYVCVPANLTVDQIERLEKIASDTGQGRSTLIRNIIKEYLENPPTNSDGSGE